MWLSLSVAAKMMREMGMNHALARLGKLGLQVLCKCPIFPTPPPMGAHSRDSALVFLARLLL